ncbi:MAG: hypothetical protein J6J60_04870 [Clostridia bacterium]|nr:hypothetical protein [Clostridia bacterium]
MENASKALIIAGAILITLIIIGLGVAILGSTEGATDTSTFDAMQVSSFNNKFKPYEGTIVGSKVDALCDILIATARSGKDVSERPNVQPWAQFKTSEGGVLISRTQDTLEKEKYIYFLKEIKNNLSSAERYTVELDYDENTDLVHMIKITK